MEYKNKIIPTKVILSLDGSESFIIRRLKERINADPIQFGYMSYADSKGKKYKIEYDNEINKTDMLKTVEFIYYKEGDHSPDMFELNNFITNNIKIKDTVDVSYKLILFGDKRTICLYKIVEFFIIINDTYTVKIIGNICIDERNTIINCRDIFNKITSVVLADRYAFIGKKFKIDSDHIYMKINYAPGFNMDNMCTEFISLLEDALEKYYAHLRELAAKK